jgi:hypothetical protein
VRCSGFWRRPRWSSLASWDRQLAAPQNRGGVPNLPSEERAAAFDTVPDVASLSLPAAAVLGDATQLAPMLAVDPAAASAIDEVRGFTASPSFVTGPRRNRSMGPRWGARHRVAPSLVGAAADERSARQHWPRTRSLLGGGLSPSRGPGGALPTPTTIVAVEDPALECRRLRAGRQRVRPTALSVWATGWPIRSGSHGVRRSSNASEAPASSTCPRRGLEGERGQEASPRPHISSHAVPGPLVP